MKRLRLAVSLLVAAAALDALEMSSASARNFLEPPSLAAAVAEGTLPPVMQRLPDDPLVVDGPPGESGGELTMLMSGPKDTRMMVVFGYARLVGYTPALTLAPDLVKSVDDGDGDRIFTFHLSSGLKWSDGVPFTAADFRFWYEDVAENAEIAPSGLPPELLVSGEKPRVEFPDALTVRYSWSRPNAMFLPALARPDPLYIYMPEHYLRQFHTRYADRDKLAQLVKAQKQRTWAGLFNKLSNAYRNDNPDLPTLEPWVLRTKPPADRLTFERNPYFHRVDAVGRQLPYIDRVSLVIADSKIIPAMTGEGASDLQARYLRFDNYTFLKQAEQRNHYVVRLWRTTAGSQLALFPNLNCGDPTWRALLRDVRFRRALSLAIDRHEINQAIYYGVAKEGQNTVLPDSPLFRPEFRNAWARFDLAAADTLLDEMGLTKRDSEGLRVLPNDEPLRIVVESAGESTQESDVLELIRDTWREAGIALLPKPSQLTVFRNRVFAGAAMMTISHGIEDGLLFTDTPPVEFCPVRQQQLQWPKWGQYYEDKGKAGEAPDLNFGRELLRLFDAWLDSSAPASRREIWQDILKITADEVPTIGIAAGVPQPVVVRDRLRNVPESGIYNWDPGAYFGIYHPDHFWFESSAQPERREPETR
jgi:peptide/nickel transport system substrate-binding protein